MLIHDYIKKYSTFSEYSKSFRKARSDKDIASEQLIHGLISRTGTELSSVVSQIKGLDFVVTLGKQRISGDKIEKYQNYSEKAHKGLVARTNKNGKLGVINEVNFNGRDMKEISFFLKNKTIITKNHNLGLKGGFVMDESDKLYYLMFLDIDNKGLLTGKASGLRKAFGLDTFTVATPSDGYHLYLLLDGIEGLSEKEIDSLISDSKLFSIPNLDIKMKGYVLSPGSITEKGIYEVINDTEIATLNIKSWREELFNRIKPFLVENNIPFEDIVPVSASLVEGDKREDSIDVTPQKPCKTGTSKKATDKKLFLEMFETGSVPVGSRNDYLFWTASYIVGKNKSFGFDYCLTLLTNERNRVGIDSEEFNESVLGKMVSYLFQKEEIREKNSIGVTPQKPCNPERFSKKTDLSGFFTKQLIEKLSTFTKSEQYEMKIEKVAALVQRYFELRFAREYSKPILTKAVGDFLTSAGFSKKVKRFNGIQTRVWNISEASLVELEAFVTTFEPAHAVSIAPSVHSNLIPESSVVLDVPTLGQLDQELCSAYKKYQEKNTVFDNGLIIGNPSDTLFIKRNHLDEQKTKTCWN
jgi:hypothetical protein